MLPRVETEDLLSGLPSAFGTRAAEPIVPVVADADDDGGHLPNDHPHWVRDAVAISRAARELVARLRPIVVRALTIWDHAVRCIAIGGRRVGVDASGSYRIEP